MAFKQKMKKSTETAIIPVHRDLKETLDRIRKQASDQASISISRKEASILANMKINKAPIIKWDEAKEELFKYGYKKRE